MIEDTLNRIESRIQGSESISDEGRDELLGLLGELKAELTAGSEGGAPAEAVQSALGLTEAAAHETARADKESDTALKDQTVGALQTSIQELEASHPRAAEMIARISHVLSRMGI